MSSISTTTTSLVSGKGATTDTALFVGLVLRFGLAFIITGSTRATTLATIGSTTASTTSSKAFFFATFIL